MEKKSAVPKGNEGTVAKSIEKQSSPRLDTPRSVEKKRIYKISETLYSTCKPSNAPTSRRSLFILSLVVVGVAILAYQLHQFSSCDLNETVVPHFLFSFGLVILCLLVN